MLCPEVWNFKAPDSRFSSQKTDVNQASPIINKFFYSHLVSVVLPDTFQVPETLTEVLNSDCDYYKISNLSLEAVISKPFLTNFVHSGDLYILSVNTRLDCDNCVAVTPTGKLILNLNKKTYQELGLEGSVSHFHTKTKDRYIVSLDLKLATFKPGKPNYERVRKCFRTLKFNVIVTWEPPNDEICPSSIANFFNDCGYETKLCKISHTSRTLYSVKVPDFNEVEANEFVEWLGMVSVNADLESGPESYASTYETPEPNSCVGQVKILEFKGFFTNKQIHRFWDQLRDYQKNSDQWISIFVQGFSDSPIVWGLEEHHYYTNGDNGFVIALKGETCLLCTQQCSRKRYRNK